jgi:hypothetical protein
VIFPNRRNTDDPQSLSLTQKIMDPTVILLAVLTIALIVTAIQAWRNRNEKRDVVLIAAFAGLFAAGTAAAAIL